MRRLLRHALALAFVLLPPGAAAATQSLPRWLPDGSPYRDVDLSAYDLPDAFTPRPAWRAVPPVPPVRRLVWKGWLAASEHRADAARLHFGRALRISPNDRHLLWAYGWAQLNLGQPADALAAFARQLALRPGQRPRWLPMALALSYTAAGERDLARRWLAVARHSDPARWASDGLALRSTLDWTPAERDLLRRLLQSPQPTPPDASAPPARAP